MSEDTITFDLKSFCEFIHNLELLGEGQLSVWESGVIRLKTPTDLSDMIEGEIKLMKKQNTTS